MPVTTQLECDACGNPDATPFYRPEGHTEALCPACARNAALIDAAHADLHAQLAPVLQAWAGRWAGVNVGTCDLGHILNTEGLHWHPLGVMGRSGHPQDNAQAFIHELLECAK